MVKLTDVAKLAGVSPTTVSRVINNRGYISQATKVKVKDAMKQLNYHPNLMARSLTGKTTGLIGLIFTDTSNPFFAELVSKLESRLFKKGYKAILCNSVSGPEKEREYLQMLVANKVDGIISGTHNLNIEEYNEFNAPIIAFDRDLSPKIPVVSSDNYQGGKLATEFLVKSNCKNIHVIASRLHSANPTDNRVKAYLDVLKANHLEPHCHELGYTLTPKIKEMLIRNILRDNKVDGIFCTDDLTAILVSNIAKKIGIEIPEQLKLVGYDGTELIQTYFPSLTTIKQPIDAIRDVLVKELIDRINHNSDSKENVHFELPVELILGQ